MGAIAIFVFILVLGGLFTFIGMKIKGRKSENVSEDFKFATAAFGFAGLGVFVLWLLLGISIVPAGHVGVQDMFGEVSDNTLKPGVHWVSPFYSVEKMSFKTQEIKESMNVLSKEGLNVTLEVSLLYHLDPEIAHEIYKTVGPEYVSIIVTPQFRSTVRSVTARFEAKALYSYGRDSLAILMETELAKLIAPRGVIVETTPLRDLDLPSQLTKAIETKLRIEQEAEQMEFTLQKETKEAERKRIEARGIADFQTIVSKGISAQLLKWKGIEATTELAKSPNTKIVVIGAGKDGLPLILGGN
jgi:prohibitin 1